MKRSAVDLGRVVLGSSEITAERYVQGLAEVISRGQGEGRVVCTFQL